jgi:hypothetical protein
VIAVALLVVIAALLVPHHLLRRESSPPTAPSRPPATVARQAARPARHGSGAATWWYVLLACGVVAFGLAVARRPGAKGAPLLASDHDSASDAGVVDALDDTLDALRGEPDPRRAIIAAYACMERGLRAAGIARAPAEAPFEYLSRIVTDGRVSAAAATRLTELFEVAKFSTHELDEDSRGEAISALESIRHDVGASSSRVVQ